MLFLIMVSSLFDFIRASPQVQYKTITQESYLEMTREIEFIQSKFCQQQHRLQELQQFTLKNVLPPGLQEIKQVKIFTKWRKFVLAEFQDPTFPNFFLINKFFYNIFILA
jgi:hypothetical protein